MAKSLAKRVADAQIEMVPIDDIVIGFRRREKPRGVAALAKSIEADGLLHPIILGEHHELTAGRCRLEAARKLGWRTIPARIVPGLTPEELREIELAENQDRDDLTTFEASAARMQEIEAIEAEGVLGSDSPKPRGGRPKGGDREIGRRLGVDHKTIAATRKHIEVATRFPFLKGADWSRGNAEHAVELLEGPLKAVQETVVEIITERGCPRSTAMKIMENLATKPKAEVKQIVKQFKSDDPEEQDVARAKAAAMPPPMPNYFKAWSALAVDARLAFKKVPDQFAADAKEALKWIETVNTAMRTEYERTKAGC